MSLKICTAEFMISDDHGVGMRRGWFPRVVAERFLESTKDGEIQRAPDPVTMIDGDLTWFNNSPDPQQVLVQVQRASRSIVAANPITVVIHDAWSFDVGVNPSAEYPSVMQDTFGGRAQFDRASVARDALQFGHFYLSGDGSQAYVEIGLVPSMQAMHFRYLCAVQTPGVWTLASEWEPRIEAQAHWTRLLAFATPAVTS